MTRDSASGTGPEPDPVNEVKGTPGATEATSPTDGTKPVSTDEAATAATTGENKPVAVDTTDDEPGNVHDTTDEGAVGTSAAKSSDAESGTPNLTLRPLPAGSRTSSTEDTAVIKDESVTGGATAGDSTEPTPAGEPTVATASTPEPTKPLETSSADSATTASSASQPTTTPLATSEPEATPASSASQPTTTPLATSEPKATPASSASQPTTTPEATPTSSTGPVVTPAPVPVAASPISETSNDPVTDPDGTVPPPTSKPEKHSTLVPLVGTLVALAALAALLIGSMALPISRSAPNSVPVGVAGAEEITGQLTTLMEQIGGPDTFEVEQFTNRADLVEAIEDREVYGGLFVDNAQAQMLIASAAGIEVSDALQRVASTLQNQAQAAVQVTDVVPQPADDARGDGLSATELPLAVAAALPAFGLILLYRRRPLAQIGGAVLASAGVGLAVAAVLTYGSRSTEGGNFWLLSAGLAAGIFATTMILLGIYALAGRIGLGIGAAVLVLFGAPLSGLSSAPEWLPDPWGTLGQLLPPGATATALRSMAFFDGAGSRSALLVMLMWTAVGLLLLGLGTLLHRSNQRLATLQAEEQAAQDEEKSPATV